MALSFYKLSDIFIKSQNHIRATGIGVFECAWSKSHEVNFGNISSKVIISSLHSMKSTKSPLQLGRSKRQQITRMVAFTTHLSPCGQIPVDSS